MRRRATTTKLLTDLDESHTCRGQAIIPRLQEGGKATVEEDGATDLSFGRT